MMRSAILYILLLTLLASCGGKQGEVVIRGHFDNLTQADFYIYSTDGGRPTVDTIHVQSGRFEYKSPLMASATYHLVYPHMTEQIIFASSGDVISVKGDASNLREVTVSGNDDNKAYTALRMQLNKAANEAARDSITQAYIADHRNSRIANYLQQQLTQRGPLRPLIRKDAKLPRFILRNDSTAIDSLDGKAVGKRVVNADSICSDSLRGHNTLIVFYHYWDHDPFSTVHHVRQALCKHDSLHAVLYSLDTDYNQFRRALQRDSMLNEKYTKRATAYCDRLALRSLLVAQWRLHEFPYFILVDAKGRIKTCTTAWEDLKL